MVPSKPKKSNRRIGAALAIVTAIGIFVTIAATSYSPTATRS